MTEPNVPRRASYFRPLWALVCVLMVLPVAAGLHNVVFYRPTCMLNPFGQEYDRAVVWQWLSRDPSLPWAIVLSVCVYAVGKRWGAIRTLAWPVVPAFMPLAVWIWDIPFTGRIVCTRWHDNRLQVLGHPIHSRHLYILGAVLYVAFLGLTLMRRRAARPSEPPAPTITAA